MPVTIFDRSIATALGTTATKQQITEVLLKRPLTKDDLIKTTKSIGLIISHVDAAECLIAS